MGGYPADWDKRRRIVYQRDGYMCQRCGVGGGPNGNHELHAHHIVPISEGGSHELDNLLTLCRNCHTAVHNNAFAPQWGPRDAIDGTMPDPSLLPPEIQPYFEYAHSYNDVVDEYEYVIELLNDLDEMLEIAVSLEERGDALPDPFHEAYIPKHQKLLTNVHVLDRRADEFVEIRKDEFSSELRDICAQFEKELLESIDCCVEYSEQRRKVVKGILRYVKVEKTSDSEDYKRMVELRNEHMDLLEESQNLLLELQKQMIAEINDKLEKYPNISVYSGHDADSIEESPSLNGSNNIDANPQDEFDTNDSNRTTSTGVVDQVQNQNFDGSPDDSSVLLFAKGYTGQVRLYDDRIELLRNGLMAKLTHWGEGPTEIPLEDISAIDYKEPGWFINGYIRFEVEGDGEDIDTFDATRDEHSVVILNWQEDEFLKLKSLLEG